MAILLRNAWVLCLCYAQWRLQTSFELIESLFNIQEPQWKRKQMELQLCILFFEVWPNPAAHLICCFKGNMFGGDKLLHILNSLPIIRLDFVHSPANVISGALEIFTMGPYLPVKRAKLFQLCFWLHDTCCISRISCHGKHQFAADM